MGVLVHDQDDRALTSFGVCTCGDNGNVDQLMVVNTFNIHGTLSIGVNNVAVFAC